MDEAFRSSLVPLLDPTTLAYLGVGIVIGMAVGILPGLGATVTLALMLPFIYGLSPFHALAFLLGMLAVTSTTGDITSILLGVPGEATSAALVVDGYQMTKQGEAGRALGAAVSSSAVGAAVGALALGLTVPLIRPVVLALQAPELFMISLFGLSLVGTLSGRSLLKGLTAGALGLLLTAIGPESQLGINRFTFGQLYLLDGLPLVPIAVGLFAIPELIDLHTERSSIARATIGKASNAWLGVRDTFQHWWLVIRCSLIGVAVGLVPGLGGGVSQWLAYAHAVQSSKDPSRFGTGAIEGVLGPGACNNSKEGGALIPTIAFGVPGSSTMAILLGAFVLLGLQPGPRMLTTQLDVTYFMVWILVIANVAGVVLSFLFLDQLARITFIRGTLLVPFIVLLVFFGSMSSGSIADLLVTLVFGGLAWLMRRLGWPITPLLLGFVLGDRAEDSLWISSRVYGFGWLTRPIVVALIIFTVVSVGYMLWRRRKTAKSPPGTRSISVVDLAFTASIFVVAAGAAVSAQMWPLAARLFPMVIGGFTAVCALAQFVRQARELRARERIAEDATTVDENAKIVLHRTAGMFGWMIALAVAIWLLGYGLVIAPFTFLYLKLVSRESWRLTIALASGAAIAYYGLIVGILRVSAPPGLLFGG